MLPNNIVKKNHREMSPRNTLPKNITKQWGHTMYITSYECTRSDFKLNIYE